MDADQLDHEIYARLARKAFPEGTLIQVSRLHGGLSAQATVMEVRWPDQRSKKFIVRRPPPWMLKKNPDAASLEFRLLQALVSMEAKVQRPVFLDAIGEFLGTPALVLEYAEGANDFAPADLSSTLQQMAVQMANIHAFDATKISFLPQKDASLPPIKPDVAYSDAEIGAREFLKSHWPLTPRRVATLVHGDFWPGNLLWEKGALTRVLDWEQAGICDPLYDLAVSRLDILWLFGADAMEEFTRNYSLLAKTEVANLPYWDLRSALRTAGQFALWAGVYPGLGRPDVTETTMRDQHAFFVDEALRKVNSGE